jgi:hypothetical protein
MINENLTRRDEWYTQYEYYIRIEFGPWPRAYTLYSNQLTFLCKGIIFKKETVNWIKLSQEQIDKILVGLL